MPVRLEPPRILPGWDRQRSGPVVLVVNADGRVRETAELVCRDRGIQVNTAASGAAGIACAQRHPPDLAVIEDHLPDMSGLDLVDALKREGNDCPWVLVSRRMTVELAVQAMKAGARDVAALPVDVEDLLVSSVATVATRRGWPRPPIRPRLRPPRSSAERSALLVLRACDAEFDLNTIEAWATFEAVSYRTLTESWHIVGVPPHDARDLMRTFRYLCRNNGRAEDLPLDLMVNDHRTLNALVRRAGFASARPSGTLTPRQFLNQQRFISPDHTVIALLRGMVELNAGG